MHSNKSYLKKNMTDPNFWRDDCNFFIQEYESININVVKKRKQKHNIYMYDCTATALLSNSDSL